MKRNVTIILAALLAVSLTACGNSNESSSANNSTASGTGNSTSESSVKDAVELLTAAWNGVPEDSKFPVFGGAPGDDIENITENAPGAVPVDNTDALEVHLAFPAASADKIDNAASLIHMMNANTFTAGAYHVKDAGTISDVTAAIKDSVINKQWMCGFPEKLVIVTVDDYIVSVFGHGEPVDAFIGSLTAEYPSAQKVCDDPIELGGGDPVIGVGGDFAVPLDWQRDDYEIMLYI